MYFYISRTKFLARTMVALCILKWKTWQIGCPFTSLALIQREARWERSLTAKHCFIETSVKKNVSSSECESCSLFTTKSGLLFGFSMRPWLQSLQCFHTARLAKNLKWSWNTFWLTMFCHPITFHLNLKTMKRSTSGWLKRNWVLNGEKHFQTTNCNQGWRSTVIHCPQFDNALLFEVIRLVQCYGMSWHTTYSCASCLNLSKELSIWVFQY